MSTSAGYRAIYDRHRGPYSLILNRVEARKVKGQEKQIHSTDRCRGPMSAEEAHEMAVMLVTDPRDNVQSAFVFSDTESQYIGAFYERGKEAPSWSEIRAGLDSAWDDDGGDGPAGEVPDPGVEPADEVEAPALLPSEREPLPTVDVPRADTPEAPKRRARVHEVPAGEAGDQDPAARSIVRPARKGAALVLDPGNAERWPTSKGPALVRAWFEAEPGRQATVKDIEAALGPALIEAGVQFPKSLVSRLKQGGFLKETE